MEVYLMARLTYSFIYLFFIISLLATDVVTHDCRGLAGGNIRVSLIRLVAFGAS